jgi:hypothetical protein
MPVPAAVAPHLGLYVLEDKALSDRETDTGIIAHDGLLRACEEAHEYPGGDTANPAPDAALSPP